MQPALSRLGPQAASGLGCAQPADPRKPRANRLFVFGWPSHLGGADTRLAHALPIWRELMDVVVVPNDRFRLDETAWRLYLAAQKVEVAMLDELPSSLDGFAIAMSNQRFFADRIAHRAREKGLYVIWSCEMMWHHEGELDAVAAQVVDCVLYTSEFNRGALQPGYLAKNPRLCQHVIGNYIDPTEFPYRPRAADDRLTIGRLSRPDPLKYPEDFPLFYELLGLCHPRYRVMAWDSALAHKYRWHHFGAEWQLLPAGEQSACAFLHGLSAFVYPLGHRFQESWGRSTVEAMLTGLPVVVPAGHHFTSLIKDGETGFLCTSHRDFQRACRALEQDPALRHRVGLAAHRFAREVLCDRAQHVSMWKEIFNA